MKTKHLLLTLLTIILHAGVKGQTQGHRGEHRTLPVLGNDKNTSNNNKGKLYPTIVYTEEKKVESQNTVTSVANDKNTYNFLSNTNCYVSQQYAKELINQAESLSLIETTLLQQAKGKTGTEKAKIIEAAKEISKQAELKLIQASEIAGKLNQENFNAKDSIFLSILANIKVNESLLDQAKDENNQAKRLMKMAREMREEAYAMHSNAAKLGTLNNAEEQETEALVKQDDAINTLKKIASSNKQKANDLAVK